MKQPPRSGRLLQRLLSCSRAPRAISVPVALVMRLTVEETVVVAATLVPVMTPSRVEELAGTPVVAGKRSGRLSLGHARRADAGKTQSCGDSSRCCDAFQCHAPVVPPRSTAKTPHLGVLAGDLLSMNLMVTDLPGGEAPSQAVACDTVIGWQRPASSLAP
jgi:hypothetical protein